jgi:GNAT superfamily N-acetyltransferase
MFWSRLASSRSGRSTAGRPWPICWTRHQRRPRIPNWQFCYEKPPPRVTNVAIEALRQEHDLSSFTCGRTALDEGLRARAWRNQTTGDSRTFVIAPQLRVLGYYALSTASAVRVGLPGALRRNAPDPVPLLLLGQLAVDVTQHGKGLGRRLLGDACLRSLEVLRRAGFRALATHPIDQAAARFYARFGFMTVPDSTPPLMMLAIGALEAASPKQGS